MERDVSPLIGMYTLVRRRSGPSPARAALYILVAKATISGESGFISDDIVLGRDKRVSVDMFDERRDGIDTQESSVVTLDNEEED